MSGPARRWRTRRRGTAAGRSAGSRERLSPSPSRKAPVSAPSGRAGSRRMGRRSRLHTDRHRRGLGLRPEVRPSGPRTADGQVLGGQHLVEVVELAGRHPVGLERGDGLHARVADSQGRAGVDLLGAIGSGCRSDERFSSIISSHASHVMHVWFHCSAIGAAMTIQPSLQRCGPSGGSARSPADPPLQHAGVGVLGERPLVPGGGRLHPTHVDELPSPVSVASSRRRRRRRLPSSRRRSRPMVRRPAGEAVRVRR